nr:MAG TPA: acetyltransferase domain containing protein [Caudoviricetes sp.]
MSYELYHYGILGMKWGVRRYQNLDGTLTSAGKKKYTKVDTLRSTKTGEEFYIAQKRNRNAANRDRDFTITKNGKKIGSLFLEDHGSDLYVNWVDIKKSERGKGYANQVMDYVVKYSMRNGYKTISLEVPTSSPDARHIYEKHGFVADRKVSDQDDVWEGLTSMKRQN